MLTKEEAYSYDTITNLIKDYYHVSKIKKAKKMRDEEPQLY